MSRAMPRRLSAGRAGLVVTVTAPDGGALPSRGLGAWLASAAPRAARGDVTIALVSDGRMRSLNRSFRGADVATDVLSFPAFPGELEARHSPRGYLGDIVIAGGVARRQALAAGHSLGVELRVLALHGLLHLLGYDHETDKGQMSRMEAALRKKAGLKEGLIGRVRRRESAHAPAPARP